MSEGCALIGTPSGWWLASEPGALAEWGEELAPPPAGARVARAWLPMEALVVHPLRLPLARAEWVRRDLVLQALLAQTALDEPEQWHLCWDVAPDAEGVSGIVAGMPEMLRQQLIEAGWEAEAVGIDAQAALSRWAEAGVRAGIVAADQEGAFVGFWDGARWTGFARLDPPLDAALEEAVRRLWAAMGWREGDAVRGRAPEGWAGLGLEPQAELPTRAEAVAEGAWAQPRPDFRCGVWAPRREARSRYWVRAGGALALVGVSAALMLASEGLRYARAYAQAEARLMAAFHEALGDQPVVDPILQLRRAAGGGAEPQALAAFLRMLARLGAARDLAQIEAVAFSRDEGFVIDGKAKDLAAVEKLTHALGEAEPLDSQLTDEGVRFRIRVRR